MLAVAITETSQVGEARRLCVEVAQEAGFDTAGVGRVALVATELATNLLKHGGGGELLCGPWSDPAHSDPSHAGLDLLALDRGPGMRDPGLCLRDGYSTAGTSGTGLGAVRRNARLFRLQSAPGSGSAVLARLAIAASRPTPDGLAIQDHSPMDLSPAWGAVTVPHRGERACGDAWTAISEGALRVFLMADGLGHGPDAAHAAAEAVRRFRQAPLRPPGAILEAIHQALRPTRGAAVAIARVDAARGAVTFAGIGNIGAAVVAGTEIRRMLSHNGTAGHQLRRIQEFEYPWPDGAVLVMHSDGLASSWWPPRQAGLLALHPTLAAALLYRDHARGRDDCCVLVAATPASIPDD
ncbi:Phosphoserine phosphatase rsbX [Rhodovastum atsumiense]|uniref:SpoIIE family protein phosphatase n=1 Tax=Rhodovastum atsumiense TaxID=504468 RepID=A0A5M6ITU2_9PROT|nr:ATP-binding SpoIIE family protein phosphatase [Rhodovastum atsumiense]KAA5611743.1 SpoIIE family protein phosphatase [Rhodovastum atsumiense]CAH2604325.1 Phosphoserine phosphatase rsbX [Rhodovastum atsumiense]